MSNYKIPFSKTRTDWTRSHGYLVKSEVEGLFLEPYEAGDIQVDNYVFEDDLEYYSYSRGRSSAVLEFRSKNREFRAQMFMSDFDDMLQAGVDPKNASGRFTFVKKGANYGVKFLGAKSC